MQKLIGLVAAALLASACTQPLINTDSLDSAAAPAAAERAITQPGAPVSFYAETTRNYYIYHGVTGIERCYSIVVADLAFDKQVNVRFEMANGTWQDFPASFVADINGNEELWQLKINGANGYYGPAFQEFGDEFAISYTVNGTSYWDNNGGQNYYERGAYLKPGCNVFRGAENSYNNAVYLRNLAYAKKVTILYTTDNWASTKTTSAWFDRQIDGTDLESWFWYIQEFDNSNPIQYCFKYEVDGQTYWDNNFGKNYLLGRY